MKLEPKRKGFKSARLAFNPVIKFRHKMVIMKDDMIVNNFNVVMIRSLHVHYFQIEQVGGHLRLPFCNLGLCDLGDSQVSSSSSSPRSFSRIVVMITMTIDKAWGGERGVCCLEALGGKQLHLALYWIAGHQIHHSQNPKSSPPGCLGSVCCFPFLQQVWQCQAWAGGEHPGI